MKDRVLLETESSIRIFDKAYGWLKLFGGAVLALLVAFGTLLGYNTIDLRKTVTTAKNSVISAGTSAEDIIKATAQKTQTDSTESLKQINSATERAKTARASFESEGTKLTQSAYQVRKDMKGEASGFARDVKSARVELQNFREIEGDVRRLQYQFVDLRGLISQANLSTVSPADIAKKIYGAHRDYWYELNSLDKSKFVILPPRPGDGFPLETLFLCLKERPVRGSFDVHLGQLAPSAGSFGVFDNVLIVDIPKDLGKLISSETISISDFPDEIKTCKLEIRDGQVLSGGHAVPRQKPPAGNTP